MPCSAKRTPPMADKVRLVINDKEHEFPTEHVVEVTRFPDGSVFVGVKDSTEQEIRALKARVRILESALAAAESVMWMAEQYLDGGRSHPAERCDYDAAMAEIAKARPFGGQA